MNSLGNDAEVCLAFLSSYIEHSDIIFAELKAAVTSRDPDQIRISFHKFRGMVANLYYDEYYLFLNQIAPELGLDGEKDKQILEIIQSFQSEACSSVRKYLGVE